MHIDDTRPIWIQLVENYRQRIATGTWTAGSKIPSVRELALEAGVNPNTVQRALTELDRAGLTKSERTTGRFVTLQDGTEHKERARLATQATDAHVRTMSQLGLSLQEATALLTERWTPKD
ncbi:MAG: GntR family transcriptional regulator [Buchananella hordeovulneris]|nr:GntR family transcriptional regulator [Buchananella hordeovulneris]